MNDFQYNPNPDYMPHEMQPEAYGPYEQDTAPTPRIPMETLHANNQTCYSCMSPQPPKYYSAEKVLGVGAGALVVALIVVGVLILLRRD